MAEEQFSLLNPQPMQEQYGLAPANAPINQALAPAAAEKMAWKAKFGLPTWDKAYPEVVTGLTAGAEPQLRQEAASHVDVEKVIKNQEAIIRGFNKPKSQAFSPANVTDLVSKIAYANQPTPPDTVWEDYYSKQYTQEFTRTAQRNPESFAKTAETLDPVYIAALQQAGSTPVGQVEIAKALRQKAHEEYQKQGWVSWLGDQAKWAIPGYKDWKIRGIDDGTYFKNFGTNLIGTELEGIISELSATRDLTKFKNRAQEIGDRLMKDNPGLAMEFYNALVGRPVSDVNLDNVLSAVDVLYMGQAAKYGLNTIKNTATRLRIQQALKDIPKSAANEEVSPNVAMAAGSGDAGEAGVRSASETTLAKLAGELDPSEEALRAMTSHVTYDGFLSTTNPSRNYREMANRLVDQANDFVSRFKENWQEVVKVDRLAAYLRVEANIRKLKDNLKDSFPGLNNALLDISKPYKNELGTGYKVDFHIGQRGATHFTEEETAHMWAKMNGLSEYLVKSTGEVKGEGGMYYIKISRALKETDDVIRDGLILTDYSKSPGLKGLLGEEKEGFTRGMTNYISSFAGKYRNPDDILSLAQRLERKNVVYGYNLFSKLAKEEARYLEQLSRGFQKVDTLTGDTLTRWTNRVLEPSLQAWHKTKRFSDWNRAVSEARVMENDGRLGKYFGSPGELESWYQQHIKRLPDDVEIEAYFAYKRLGDLDHMLTNMRVWSNKTRVGIREHVINALDQAGNPVTSPKFDGARQNYIPRSNDTIAWFKDNSTNAEYRIGSENKWQKSKEYKELEQAVNRGEYKVIRLWNPDEKELKTFGNIGTDGKRPVYIVVKNTEEKAIAYEQVPRREGGHHVYDYNHYIKQAQVNPETIGSATRHIYTGDATIMPIRVRAMGQDIAKKLDQVRLFLKDGKEAEAQAFAKANLPMKWDEEINSWFKGGRTPEGAKIEPLLNLHEPIQVVPANKNIRDMSSDLKNRYSGTWKDGTTSGNLSNQYEVQFTGQRDNFGLRTVVNKGSATNPIYDWQPAALMDPIPTMNRALQKIIQTNFLDDYKIMSAEHWLQEAIQNGVLKASKDEIRSSPFFHFSQPEYVNGLDKAVQARFEATNYAIKQLWGQQTEWQKSIQAITQKMMDSIYNKYGEGRALAIADWALPYAQDPLSIFRTMTFHAKIGLFAIPQIMVQLQTYSNIYAISGIRSAGAGTTAALFRLWGKTNATPEYLKMLDQKIAGMNLGWKPGQWLEATEWLKRTGLEFVQGEHAMLDNTLSAKLIRTGTQDFLDSGTWFFREGERNARRGAWYAAYHEFREGRMGKLQPYITTEGRLTEQDAKLILERADILYGNMSRASSSALHQGVFSWTSQFLAYQMRLMEQMVGKRLTVAERGRMFAVNAGLYGMPAATGLSGIPFFGDKMREIALNNGYVIGENWYTSALMEGWPAVIGALITGTGTDPRDRLKTGNWYNFGPRFGNSGFEWMREIYRNDGHILKAVLGAPGSTIANTISNADPFFKAMKGLITNDFPTSNKDYLDVFNEVSSVSRGRKFIASLTYGNAYSTKEAKLLGEESGGVSPGSAFFSWISGTQDQRIDDIWHKANIKKTIDEQEKDAMTGFSREFRRSMQAAKDDQWDLSRQFYQRARAYLVPIPEQRQVRVIARAVSDRNNHDLISNMNWDFYVNNLNVTNDKKQTMQNAYQEIQRQNQLKRVK